MTTTEHGAEQAPRRGNAAPRPLFAACRAALQAAPAADPNAAKTNGGRWKLNAGSEMQMCIWGVNMQAGPWGPEPAPIRCVLDLATAKLESPTIRCLLDHIPAPSYVLGRWEGAQIDDQGVVASLTWLEPKTPDQATVLANAVLMKALVDQGDPMEVSIGASPAGGLADYESIADDEDAEVNGRVYAGAGDLPLFVLHNALISEASLVLWGADSDTGQVSARLAAHRHTLQESSMTQPLLTAGLASFVGSLIASFPGQEAAILAALSKATDATIEGDIRDQVRTAELTAARAQITSLQAAAAKPAAPAVPPPAEGRPPGAGAAAGQLGAGATPADFYRLRAEIGAETKKKGLALNEEVYRRHPALRAAMSQPTGAIQPRMA